MPMAMSEHRHQWTREEENEGQRVKNVPCVIPKQISAQSGERERNGQPEFGYKK